MSLATDVHIDAIDVRPQGGYEAIDAHLRLHDFYNNRRLVGKIPLEQLEDYVVEEAFGQRERELFSALGHVVMHQPDTLDSREELKLDFTEYGDPVYSILRHATHESGATRVVNLIAVEGLFLFGHEHFSVIREGRLNETAVHPLQQGDYTRFWQKAGLDQD